MLAAMTELLGVSLVPRSQTRNKHTQQSQYTRLQPSQLSRPTPQLFCIVFFFAFCINTSTSISPFPSLDLIMRPHWSQIHLRPPRSASAPMWTILGRPVTCSGASPLRLAWLAPLSLAPRWSSLRAAHARAPRQRGARRMCRAAGLSGRVFHGVRRRFPEKSTVYLTGAVHGEIGVLRH